MKTDYLNQKILKKNKKKHQKKTSIRIPYLAVSIANRSG